jgi:putative CocE/NonD family hydrolase
MRIIESFPKPVRDIENVWIPLSDGCRLAARIWFPEDAEQNPVPAILEYIPYRKRDFMRLRDEPIHHYFAGNGYAAVRVDVRGSGDSDGLLADEYTRQELEDALEVLSWIGAQRWCTGAVGMMGISWGGFNSLQVAALQPPELKAIITLCSTDDRYADDAHYMGGCLLNENLQWGAILWTSNAYPPDPEIVGERWRAMWMERLEHSRLFPAVWLEHQHRDGYWKHGSVCEDYARVRCPVYALGGWADAYSNAVPRLLAGLQVPRKGLIGPWAHTFPHHGVPGPAIGFLQEAVLWWDHWLKGEDNGIMDEPMYRVWMQESVAPDPFYEERPGRWVSEDAWPSPRIHRRRLYLNPDKLAPGPVAETRLHVMSPQTTGLTAGNWCGFGLQGEAPTDQRPDDGGSLTFDSDPLDARLEILGAPVATLQLEVDRPVALVAVRLNDVAPDGSSTRVTYGLLNLTHRQSHEHPARLEPGRRYTVQVALNHVAYAFPPGHRMRIAVSTSYWPITWPAPEPTTLSLYAGLSTLELPVRPPDPADAELRPFKTPERGPRETRTKLRPLEFKRAIERNLATNETVYTLVSDGGELGGASLARVEAIDLEVGYTIRQRYRIGEYNPLSAQHEMEQRTQLRRREWSVRIESRIRLWATPEAFRVQAELDAYEGSARVYARSWDESLPRDLV